MVTEFGVPLCIQRQSNYFNEPHQAHMPYGASPGVSSPDGGGGRLIKVGALVAIVYVWSGLVLAMCCEWWMAQEKYSNVLGSLVTRSPGPVTNDVADGLVALRTKQGQGG